MGPTGALMVKVILCLFFSMNFAFANTDIKSAIKEFEFAVTVEGKSAQEARVYFEGFSGQEIFDAALAEVKDAQLARDLKSIQKFNLGEIAIREAVEASQARGASWEGTGRDITIAVLVSVLTVVLLTTYTIYTP